MLMSNSQIFFGDAFEIIKHLHCDTTACLAEVLCTRLVHFGVILVHGSRMLQASNLICL
jgi:hypothetical protein